MKVEVQDDNRLLVRHQGASAAIQELLLTDIKPLAVQEWLKGLNLSRKSKQNVKAAFHRVLELAMLWELMPAQRNPLSLVEVKGARLAAQKKANSHSGAVSTDLQSAGRGFCSATIS